MTDRYYDIKQKLVYHARQDKAIKAVMAIGSYTRSDVSSNELSCCDTLLSLLCRL